jgi:NAD-dependent dihydropyrimidine dehydrogenase PreA subunit
MKRKVIRIDEERCNGCGLCVSGCPEGALQVIDGKARLVGDLLCDGLGACMGTCPEGAISIEEREAEPYDEIQVLGNIIPQGRNVIQAHLRHLRDHGQDRYLQQALAHLRDRGIAADMESESGPAAFVVGGCPGSQTQAFPSQQGDGKEEGTRPSRLTHWPIQLHLISPTAPHYRGSDLLLAADCAAYALADFHRDCLKGRTLAIACPKLDSGQDIYEDKITALIDRGNIRSITVLIMQVPCCGGLLRLVVDAAGRAARVIPVRCVVVGLRGEILKEMPVATAPLEFAAPADPPAPAAV